MFVPRRAMCFAAALAGAAAAFWSPSSAPAGTIGHLDFNDPANRTNDQYNRVSLSTSTGLVPAYALGGTTVNGGPGEASGQALSFAGSSNNGRSLFLGFGMAGLRDLVFTFATQGTATGFTGNSLTYSVDGGAFRSFGSTYKPAGSLAVQTFDLSNASALDDKANVTLAVKFDRASDTGNNRLENLNLVAGTYVPPTGAATPLPAAARGGMALFGLVGGRSLLARRRRLPAA